MSGNQQSQVSNRLVLPLVKNVSKSHQKNECKYHVYSVTKKKLIHNCNLRCTDNRFSRYIGHRYGIFLVDNNHHDINYTYVYTLNYKTKEVSPVSACTSSTELAKTGRQKLPEEERDPLTHLIAERNKEKERQQRSHPITEAYVSRHLSHSKEAKRL